MELFTFLQMGGALERIDVRRLGDDQNVLRQLARFDASVAQCFKNEDRQRLLGIIESAFGSFVDFNASVRHIFAKRDGTRTLDGDPTRSDTASPQLRPEDLDNSYDLVSQAV